MELISSHQMKNGNRFSSFCTGGFQILTNALLSLLLPLSFLLLARFSTAHYLLSVSDNCPLPHPTPFLCSLFLHTIRPTILHLLISLITVSSLIQTLTGKLSIQSQSQSQPALTIYAAWVILCIVQVCVGLGIEGSIASGIDGSGFG